MRGGMRQFPEVDPLPCWSTAAHISPGGSSPPSLKFRNRLRGSDGCGSRRCGHHRSHRRRSCPVTDPGALRPPRKNNQKMAVKARTSLSGQNVL
ncbi:hypothetical protein EK904_013829 [Melospiza melodia maxima]|nr:hypothetical protein EK904_013829 [Melospiza melodia maxima]